MISSIATGVGPSAATIRARSLSSASSGPGASLRLGLADRLADGRRSRPSIGCDLGDDVVDGGDDVGAVLDQAVGAGGARVERRAGHGEDEAALLAGEARGDQRARAAAPPRRRPRRATMPEMMRLRRGKSRARGSQPIGISLRWAPPRGEDALGEAGVLRRVEVVEAAGEDGDRAGRERRLVGGGVDAAGEAGGDDEAGLAEAARRSAWRTCGRRSRRCASRRWRRSAATGRRRSPRTVISGGAPSTCAEPRRIVRLADGDEARAEPRRPPRARARRPPAGRCGCGGRRARRGSGTASSAARRCRND